MSLYIWKWIEPTNDYEKSYNMPQNGYLTCSTYTKYTENTTEEISELQIKHQIIYHESFQAPMLCIAEAYNQRGIPIPLSNLQEYIINISNDFKDIIPHLSLIPHPITQLPCIAIHPCQTSVIFQTFNVISSNSSMFLVNWLHSLSYTMLAPGITIMGYDKNCNLSQK